MEIYVDCKGNVMPCCFVGTMHNSNFQNNETLQIRKEINNYGKDKINLNNYSLVEILDSDYYQEYSYEIQSKVPFTKYSEVLKKIIHVAGTRMFGKVILSSDLDISANVSSKIVIS